MNFGLFNDYIDSGIGDNAVAFPSDPNEDTDSDEDGNNDTWVIPKLDNYPDNKVSVYKRWGHPVYEAKGYANDYEGFFNQNREKLPRGSYLYVIDLGDGGVLLGEWIFINY